MEEPVLANTGQEQWRVRHCLALKPTCEAEKRRSATENFSIVVKKLTINHRPIRVENNVHIYIVQKPQYGKIILTMVQVRTTLNKRSKSFGVSIHKPKSIRCF